MVNTTAAGALTLSDIVAPGDYQQTGSLEVGGVTCLRVRGFFSCRATVLDGICGLLIVCRDADEPVGVGLANEPLTLGGDIINGEVMWRRSLSVPTDTIHHVEFDVRCKRRLQGQSITFVVRSYNQATTWSYSARALLKGG